MPRQRKEKSPDDHRARVQTLGRAVQILEAVVSGRNGVGITELRQATGLPLATLHRILGEWLDLGFVQQEPDTRRYSSGFRLMHLGLAAWEQLDVRKLAHPIMERLATESGESVYLTVREGDEGVVIDVVDGPSALHLRTSIGARQPLHLGISRRSLLAYLPPDEIAATLGRVEARGGRVPVGLEAGLAEIRAHDYGVGYGEVHAGTAGVSVPIRDARGRVQASLTVGGPEGRFTGASLDRLIDLTVSAGREISARLGYNSK